MRSLFNSAANVAVVLIIMGEGGGGGIEEQNTTTVEYSGASIKCVTVFPE
jgi:hypothetical protein